MRFAGQRLAEDGFGLGKNFGFDPVQPAPLPPLATMEPPVMTANLLNSDHVDALANGGVSGSGARAMPRAGVGGGGAAIGSEQLEDMYLGNDDSDFGTYDPAERSFFPGV